MMRIWFWLLCFVGLVYGQSNPDGAAMNALKDALSPLSALGDWSGDDPCKWTNVTCDSSHRVTRIQIREAGVTGTLPAALKTLSSLVDFEVTDNRLTGEIPSFAGLTSLKTVFLHDNKFTSIPADFFTGLISLREVDLDNNPFGSWEIPLSLKDATSLVEFSAANCSICGTIPEFLGGKTFPSLQKLRLSSNSLVGELPLSFAGSPLQVLSLNGQSLNGSVSVLQNMTNLTEVRFNQNNFFGPIPDLSRLVSLKTFNGRDNQLTGIVPSSFIGMESLSDVSLSNNLLQGPTPRFEAKLTPLEKGTINSFCLDTPGTPCDPRVNTLLSIVESFGYPMGFAQSWKDNDPCNGKWVGIRCAGGVITVINFKNRGLTGIISPRFADLTGVQVIILSQNNLTGTIPQELVKLSNLKTLDVSNNRLYGKVPDFKPNVVNTNGNPDIGKDPPPGTRGSPSGDSGKKPSSNVAVIGVLVVLLLIAFVTFFMIKKKRQSRQMRYASSEDQNALKIRIGSLYAGNGSECGLSSVTDHVVEPGFSIQVLREATDNFNEKNILGFSVK